MHTVYADSTTHFADSTLWTADGWCGIPAHNKVGGDDHPGWNRKRATLKRKREEEFTAQIRDIYRALTNDPETAPQAEAIVAFVPLTAHGESEAARSRALDRRASELRRRADAADAQAMQAEIALRLLYREMRQRQDDEDNEAVEFLLTHLL